MAKDYAKFIPPKQRPSKTKARGTEYFFILLLVLVICSAGGYFIFASPTKTFAAGTENTTFLSKALALVKHKKTVAIAKPAAKKMAEASDTPSVQFDFYSELPSMQVTLSTPSEAVKGLSQLKNPTAVKAASANTIPAVAMVNAAKPPVIFDTNELKSLLEAEVTPATPAAPTVSTASQYIIQLGVFESEPAAQRLLEAINSVGFEGNIVKAESGDQPMFRVQQGPFESRDLAKLTQQRMQKRGIISIIRKIA
jgi:cell division septation protein DedD